MNTRLISLGLANDRSDRDKIGAAFVINERENGPLVAQWI